MQLPHRQRKRDFGGFHWTGQLPHRHEVQGREGIWVEVTKSELVSREWQSWFQEAELIVGQVQGRDRCREEEEPGA